MGNRGNLLTLDEVLQHVLGSEDEYNEPGSTDESSEEEYEPCERVSIMFVDEENIETVGYKAVVRNVLAFLLVVMSCVCKCVYSLPPFYCRCAESVYFIQKVWKIECECCMCSFFIYLFIFVFLFFQNSANDNDIDN